MNNLEFVIRKFRLDVNEPIHVNDLKDRIVSANRLREFMDRLDEPLPDGLVLPPYKRPLI